MPLWQYKHKTNTFHMTLGSTFEHTFHFFVFLQLNYLQNMYMSQYWTNILINLTPNLCGRTSEAIHNT